MSHFVAVDNAPAVAFHLDVGLKKKVVGCNSNVRRICYDKLS